jgi:hypothetical protein
MKTKIKTFSHKAYYKENNFQHMELDLTTDDCRMVLQGVHQIGFIDSNGDTLDRPAQVFFWLRLAMANEKEVFIDIDEPAMFHYHCSIKWEGMEIFFNFHKLERV